MCYNFGKLIKEVKNMEAPIAELKDRLQEAMNLREKKAACPDELPVGARCSAQAAIGFNNAGNSFTLYINTYDGSGNEQKATFKIEY